MTPIRAFRKGPENWCPTKIWETGGVSCFESTVSEKRTRWASLSSAANSVSSATNSVSSRLHTNHRLRGTHWVRSPELSEPRKTHWVWCLKPYSPKPYSARFRKLSKSVKNIFDAFWWFLTFFSLREKCRKVSKFFSTIFEDLRRGPFPLAPFAVCWSQVGLTPEYCGKRPPEQWELWEGKPLKPYHFNRTLSAQKAPSKYCQTSTSKQRELWEQNGL